MTRDSENKLKVGDHVVVKWTANETYEGVLKEFLRKNWRVEMTDPKWIHHIKFASVPAYALIKKIRRKNNGRQ